MTNQGGFCALSRGPNRRYGLGYGEDIFLQPTISRVRWNRHPLQELDRQTLVQTKTDSADRGREVPDVRSFDRRSDDEQRSRSVVAAIVAKTPVCARRNDLVGTFLRVQSKRANDISLRTAKNVADIKLSSAKSV